MIHWCVQECPRGCGRKCWSSKNLINYAFSNLKNMSVMLNFLMKNPIPPWTRACDKEFHDMLESVIVKILAYHNDCR